MDSTGKWRIPFATEEADHAQVKRSSATPFPRTEPASNRPQLLHLAKHRPRVRFRGPGGRRGVAVARRLGGPAARAKAVSATPRAGGSAQASGGGLDPDPPGPADAPGPDAATGVAGKAREQPGGLRLQPVLRSVPAMAAETRSGAAAGAPRQREDVRGLRRGHDSDSPPPDRRSSARRRVRGGAGRQQLHLRRGHARAGPTELDRFA